MQVLLKLVDDENNPGDIGEIFYVGLRIKSPAKKVADPYECGLVPIGQIAKRHVGRPGRFDPYPGIGADAPNEGYVVEAHQMGENGKNLPLPRILSTGRQSADCELRVL